MNDLMSSPLEEGLLEDELKSIRSKLTNTTKMISSKYKKRSRATRVNLEVDGGSIKENSEAIKKNN